MDFLSKHTILSLFILLIIVGLSTLFNPIAKPAKNHLHQNIKIVSPVLLPLAEDVPEKINQTPFSFEEKNNQSENSNLNLNIESVVESTAGSQILLQLDDMDLIDLVKEIIKEEYGIDLDAIDLSLEPYKSLIDWPLKEAEIATARLLGTTDVSLGEQCGGGIKDEEGVGQCIITECGGDRPVQGSGTCNTDPDCYQSGLCFFSPRTGCYIMSCYGICSARADFGYLWDSETGICCCGEDKDGEEGEE